MKLKERRKSLITFLLSEQRPVTGSELSERFGVSRQIIVQDITALKAEGCDILSTHHGYVVKKAPYAERVFKVHHAPHHTKDELSCIVGLGGTVVNVFVEHELYGRIEAKLDIFSKDHIDTFMERIRNGESNELMRITGGFHFHTVRADSEEILDVIEEALKERDYLITK